MVKKCALSHLLSSCINVECCEIEGRKFKGNDKQRFSHFPTIVDNARPANNIIDLLCSVAKSERLIFATNFQ